jgi:hypothetical protein
MSANTSRRGLIGGSAGLAAGAIVATAAGTMAASASSRHSDAELLRLGAELEHAWAAEEAAYLRNARPEFDQAIEDENQAYFDAAHRIAHQIIEVRATTFDGLFVKASALAWVRREEEFDPEDFEDKTTDLRLAGSIANDLMLMRRYVA